MSHDWHISVDSWSNSIYKQALIIVVSIPKHTVQNVIGGKHNLVNTVNLHRNTPWYPPILQSIRTMKGTSPILLSSCMACFKVSPLRDNWSSVGRNLIFTREIRPAFSTEEWAYKSSKHFRSPSTVADRFLLELRNSNLLWNEILEFKIMRD